MTIDVTNYPQQNATTPSGISGWMKRHTLLAFIILAYGFTWPFMIADMLGSWGWPPFRLSLAGPGIILVLLMGFGPTFAALVVAGAAGGRAGLRALLSRLLIWRVGVQWYAAAIVGTFVLMGGAAAWYAANGGALRAAPPVSVGLILMLMIAFVLHGLLNGEELGWRGVALPQLLARHNALVASLILGVIWALFHLPLFFTRGGGVGGDQADESVLAFLLQVIGSSVLLTWLVTNTRGSVLFAYIFHAAVNIWSDVFHAASPGSSLAWC